MRSATALAVAPSPADPDDLVSRQVPLPFPGLRSVLPVPMARPGADPATAEAVQGLRRPAARFLQALSEVIAGGRAVRQLAGFLAPDVYAQLVRRLATTSRGARPTPVGTARIVSVHLSMVGPEATEVVGRMVLRGRSRAIAARLDLVTTSRGDRRWVCTALEWA